MAGTDDTLEKLKALIAANPDVLTGVAGSGDVKTASAALARFAGSKGITLDPQVIETAFQSRGDAVGTAEALDDAALDNVSGGGSPWCMWTKGCYCFWTK